MTNSMSNYQSVKQFNSVFGHQVAIKKQLDIFFLFSFLYLSNYNKKSFRSAALRRTSPSNILLLANFHFGNSSAAF